MRVLIAISLAATLVGCSRIGDPGADPGLEIGPDAGAGAADGNSTMPPVTLNVELTGDGTGSITSTPPGLTCTGTSCSGTFAQGSDVTLEAAPDAGSLLTAWSGACSGTDPCSLTMTRDKSVTADLATVLGTWNGTYTNTRQAFGCTFNNEGNWQMTVTADGTTFSAGASIDGLELRSTSNCAYLQDAAPTSVDATIDVAGATLTGTHDFYIAEADQNLAFPWTATVSGTTMTGSWTCQGCTGSFTLTRQ